MVRTYFITGTDTDVGKTLVARTLLQGVGCLNAGEIGQDIAIGVDIAADDAGAIGDRCRASRRTAGI